MLDLVSLLDLLNRVLHDHQVNLPQTSEFDGENAIDLGYQVVPTSVDAFLVVVGQLRQHVQVDLPLITCHGFDDELAVLSEEEERATRSTVISITTSLLLIRLEDLLSVKNWTQGLNHVRDSDVIHLPDVAQQRFGVGTDLTVYLDLVDKRLKVIPSSALRADLHRMLNTSHHLVHTELLAD